MTLKTVWTVIIVDSDRTDEVLKVIKLPNLERARSYASVYEAAQPKHYTIIQPIMEKA